MSFMHLFTWSKRVATALVLPLAVLVLASCSDTVAPLLDAENESAVPYRMVPLQSLYSMSAEDFDAAATEALSDATVGRRWCSQVTQWFDPETELCSGHSQAPPYGTAEKDGDDLVLAAATSKAGPFLWTPELNPFPSSGDFTLDVRMKMDATGVYGTGLQVGGWDPVVTEGSSDPMKGLVFQVWADRVNSLTIWFFGQQFRLSSALDWYTYRVVYEDGAYTLFVNEQYATGPIASEVIPTSLWAGNPVFQTAARDWTDLRISQVTVSAPTAEVLPVSVDIKPGGCPTPFNLRAGGVLPVAIAGTDDFDVTHIDPSTLKLETAPAEQSELGDVSRPVEPYLDRTAESCTAEGADGHTDLTVHFSNQAVVKALADVLTDVADGDEVTLKLSGSLWPEFGGTAIAGEDVVVVRAAWSGNAVPKASGR